MADVFVSYKKEDQNRVQTIIEGLRASGIDVWWDQDIPAGAPWDETITTQLETAKCVVVVWSTLSVTAPFVKEEAGRAKARGVLVPVRIHDVEPPIGFGLLQAGDLRVWKGDTEDPKFISFVSTVRKIIAGEKVATLSAPFLTRRRNWVTAAALGVVAAVALGALAFSVTRTGDPETSRAVESLRETTTRLEASAAPSPEDQAAWTEALRARSRAGYQSYLEAFPDGRYAPDANARIGTCRTVASTTYESWEERSNVLGVTRAGSFGTREDAMMSAQDHGRSQAETRCTALAEQAEAQNIRSRVEPVLGPTRCTPMGAGFTCNKQFWVTCTGEKAIVTDNEVCD